MALSTYAAPPAAAGYRTEASEAQSLADVVERLFAEFHPRLSMTVVLMTLRRCRRELDIVSGPALPELVERLGRQRLLDLTQSERRH